MPQDKIKDVFDLISDKGYFTDENEFRSYVADPNRRKQAFELMKDDGYFTDENEFNSYFEAEKKKGFQTDLGKAYETTSGGSFPKYQGMRLEGSTPMTKKVAKQPSSPSNVDKGVFQQTKQKLSKESPIVKIGAYEGALSIVNQRFNQNLELFNQAKQAGNEQAMAELQPLLQIDSQKAEGLKKGIEAQKFKGAAEEPDSFGNNINIGIYQALGTILQSPQGLTKAVMTPIMEYGLEMEPIQRELMFRTLANLDPNAMAMATLGEFGGDVTKFAEERKQTANLNRLYGGSAYDALLKGDVKNAVNYAAKDFANSLPSSTMYATGVGAGLMSAGMVGDEIRRTEEETGQAIGSKQILTAGIKAGLEVVTERMFGDGKAAVELVKKLGKDGAEQAISSAVKEIAKKGLGRKVAEQAGEEVIGESLNQIGANAADIYINGNKEVNLWDGVGDAALIALVGGGTYGGGLTTANHYLDKAKYNNAQKMREEAASLTDQAMDQPNEVAKQALEEKAAEVQAKAEEIEQKESELALNASTEKVDAIIKKENDIDEIVVALETATPETAPILEEKLEQLEEERVVLVEEATLTAEEAIKNLELDKENETINEEVNTQPMLEGVQSSRNENEGSKESPELRASKTKEEEVADLRAKEQEEIANTDPKDKEKLDEIYNRYDKLITPLLKEAKEVPALNYGKTVDTKIGKVDLVVEPNSESENKNSIKISAYDTEGRTLGFSSAIIDNKNNKLIIKVSQIKEKYQRNGIYSKIIDEYEAIAKNNGLKLERDLGGETKDSKDFWGNREQLQVETPSNEENVPLIDEVNNTEVVEPQDQNRSEKVDFTEAESLNTIYSNLKSKYGDKKGNSIYEAAIRLVNPNKNTIVEIRGNGVVVKEGEKYILKPFSNTDSNSKKWVLGTGLDVSAQFIKEQPQVEEPTKEDLKVKIKSGGNFVVDTENGNISSKIIIQENSNEFGVQNTIRTKNEDGTTSVVKKPIKFFPIEKLDSFAEDLYNRGARELGSKEQPQVETETTTNKQQEKPLNYESAIKRIYELDDSIDKLIAENPKEFKKDGTPKSNSKIIPSLKELVDKRLQAIKDSYEFSDSELSDKAKQESEKLSKEFEQRQEELNKFITKDEILESSIEDKLRLSQELTDEELEYANENFFTPDGYKFNKQGNLIETNKQQEDAISKREIKQDDKQEYQGIDGQQQGEQEDRTNQEGNVPQTEGETINRNQPTKSRKEQKVEAVERTIDDIAERLKKKFAIKTLPKGTQTSGFSQDDLIDLVANVAKEIAKTGIEISEAIKQVIADLKENGDLEGFDETEIEAKSFEKAQPKEEPKKEKVELDEPKTKTSKFYKTIFNNNTLDTANKILTEGDFTYEVKSRKESLDKATAYLERVGIEDALYNYMNNKLGELELDERVALATLLTAVLNMGIQESITQNNVESREFFYDSYKALIDKARRDFTKLGQAVNAIKLFMESMSSPELAVYKLTKSNQEANDSIKERPAVKKNASTRVSSGKKTITEGTKKAAEEVAQELNNELYGVITKGKKGLTESQKKNIKDFFNKLKVNPNAKTNAKILPVKEIVAAFVTTKVFNDFIEKVGELVAEGLSLSVAMTQVSTEFIKDKIASPDQLAQARKILSEEVNGLKEKKPLTEAQKERNAAREELRKATAEYKEMENLAKELEKERERVKKLREQESKKQADRIDKATNELLAAERKEAENNAKEIEKKIKQLEKDIVGGKALQDQVEDIINEYLKMGAMDNTANEALIDLVKERLGITDQKQAVDVATKIAKSVVTNIREKLSKKWDADILRQRNKETKVEKTKDPHKEINEFVKGVALGSMNAAQFVELFGAKYGLETLTESDFEKVRELAARVRDVETKHRKNKALNDMVQYINSKAPVTLSQLFDELWYFKVLSPALTFFLGTGDTNLTYNFTQVYNTIFELPMQQLFTSVRNKAEIGKGKKASAKAGLIFADMVRNIAMGMGKAIVQRNSLKNKEVNLETFMNVLSEQGFLKDSINYFKEIMTEGSGAFQEYESPFKSGAKTEFEIRRWFKAAKNGDVEAKKNIVRYMLSGSADLLNVLVNGVPRSLAAGDLFFSAIIKNAYLPALVREYLVKNTDLRGNDLIKEADRILFNTDLEVENAKQKAVENRMKFDIEVKPKLVDDTMMYQIFDKGEVVKKKITEYIKGLKLTRNKPLEFKTEAEAKEYARRVVAPSSAMYQIDVTDYLNVKIPVMAMMAANRLAGQSILGGSPAGATGKVLKWFNNLNDFISSVTVGMENTASGLVLRGEDSPKRFVYNPTAFFLKNVLATTTKALSRLLSFRRVGLMLARNYSNYFPPIGLLRYANAANDKSAFFEDYLEDQIPSDVEKDRMLAQAALGTLMIALSVGSIMAMYALMDDDDDKDERIKKAIADMPVGTLVGSLTDILSKDQIAAYKVSGDIQEFSVYEGLDKYGKRIWKSVKPDPSYATAIMAATYAWNDLINKDDSKLKSLGLGFASFYNQIKDMGIGQGLPKLSNARDLGQFADIVAQTTLFDNIEITKVGLATKLLQYYDRKKRLDPHWMDYVEESGTLEGTGDYILNEGIPFYNLADPVRQPLSYGMLGEEMFRTPSSEQGYFSSLISYLDSDKNIQTRNMYRWLASNGYDKVFYANVTDLKDSEGNEIKLSMFEKNKFGMLAGKASYLELKKKKADLEVIRQTGGTRVFRAEVEGIFRSNFNNIVQLVKNNMPPDAVKYEQKKNNIEFNAKVEKLKKDNEEMYGYEDENVDGKMVHVNGIIDDIKESIADSKGTLVPFEELDTFGTAIKEAKPNVKWNMITTNLNMLKGKYDEDALTDYIKYLKDLGYIQPELAKDAKNYITGNEPE